MREVARACEHGVNGIYNEVAMKTVEVVAAIIKDDKTAGEKPVILATQRGYTKKETVGAYNSLTNPRTVRGDWNIG